jgi:hypothetical protein
VDHEAHVDPEVHVDQEIDWVSEGGVNQEEVRGRIFVSGQRNHELRWEPVDTCKTHMQDVIDARSAGTSLLLWMP